MATPRVQCCPISRARSLHGMARRHVFSLLMSRPAGVVAVSVRRVVAKEVTQEVGHILLG